MIKIGNVILPFIQKSLGWIGSIYVESFRRKLDHPQYEQLQLLKKLIKDLSSTEYGRFFGITRRDRLEEFQNKIPLVEYSEIEPWIEKQKKTHHSILSSEPILLYEKTSGSSGSAKYIPYTRKLKSTFGKMACLWISDVLSHGPRFLYGKTWISISPAFAEETQTHLGVQVGLEDDSDYLPYLVRVVLSYFLIIPREIKKIKDPTDYRWVLSCVLLAAEKLEVISIWNPSYFTTLLDFIAANRFQMADDLRAGRVSRGGKSFHFSPLTENRLSILLSHVKVPDWKLLWPSLKWISCWADAGARTFADELSALFPDAILQGKGLLATESPMTLPLIGTSSGVPLIDGVFYEFMDGNGKIKLLHELEDNTEYEIVVSPRGGLIRYRIGDRIRTSGRVGLTPCFHFVGRGKQVSDLVGEKLNEIFVRESLRECLLEALPRDLPKDLKDSHVSPGIFYFMLPVQSSRPPFYALVITSEREVSGFEVERLEALLCRAYHYRYARKMEQLNPVQVWNVPGAKELYYQYYIDRGMKWGDIKYSSLICNPKDASEILTRCREKVSSL